MARMTPAEAKKKVDSLRARYSAEMAETTVVTQSIPDGARHLAVRNGKIVAGMDFNQKKHEISWSPGIEQTEAGRNKLSAVTLKERTRAARGRFVWKWKREQDIFEGWT